MPLTNIARDMHSDAIIGGTAYPKLSNANARIGVGDSSTAFNATHTDLQAVTNKFRKAVDAGYPSRVNNVLTFRATFGPAEANYTWAEWGLFNAASGAESMYSRLVEANGAKSSGSTWEFTVTSTLGLA